MTLTRLFKVIFSLGHNDVITGHFAIKSDTTYRLPSFSCVSLFLSFFKIPAGRMFVSVSVSVSSGGETKDFETAKKSFFFYFLTFFIGQYIVAFFCVYGYNLSVPGGLSGDSR